MVEELFLKANNLSISIPNYGCDKNCPYCISKMTGYEKKDTESFLNNLEKAKYIATQAGVTSVSFTSKGEILYSEDSKNFVFEVAKVFKKFPLEIQTNSSFLTIENIEWLFENHIDVIAMSIDDFEQTSALREKGIFDEINRLGMTSRLTVNLTPDTYFNNPGEYFARCKKFGIHQISFRSITIPELTIANTQVARNTAKWIEKNIDIKQTATFVNAYSNYVRINGIRIRQLPFGATVYNVDGVDTTYFDYCIQDETNEDDIRSLVYYENGHLTTGWYGSNVGRIF